MSLSKQVEQLENEFDIALLLSIIFLRRLGGRVEFTDTEIADARKYALKKGVSLEEGRFTATAVPLPAETADGLPS